MALADKHTNRWTTSFVERMRAVIHWYGPGRAAMSAGSVFVVCVGAWWLLRAPAPPLENSLPMAQAAAASTTVENPATSAFGNVPSATPLPAFTGVVTVHVVGAVLNPGVYQLPAGSRVVDAVDKAGGVLDNADTAVVNMALPVSDADQVFIPLRTSGASRPVHSTVAVVRKSPRTTSSAPGTTVATGAPTSSSGSTVNINSADAAALESLPGVGPSTAQSIIAYRNANGPFASVDDLKKVKGIGEAKFAAMKPFVSL